MSSSASVWADLTAKKSKSTTVKRWPRKHFRIYSKTRGSQLYGGRGRAKRVHLGKPGAAIGNRSARRKSPLSPLTRLPRLSRSCRAELVGGLKGHVESDLPSPTHGWRAQTTFPDRRQSIQRHLCAGVDRS